jgi:hypothetical protein
MLKSVRSASIITGLVIWLFTCSQIVVFSTQTAGERMTVNPEASGNSSSVSKKSAKKRKKKRRPQTTVRIPVPATFPSLRSDVSHQPGVPSGVLPAPTGVADLRLRTSIASVEADPCAGSQPPSTKLDSRWSNRRFSQTVVVLTQTCRRISSYKLTCSQVKRYLLTSCSAFNRQEGSMSL